MCFQSLTPTQPHSKMPVATSVLTATANRQRAQSIDETNYTCTYKDITSTNMSFVSGDTDASAMVGEMENNVQCHYRSIDDHFWVEH